MCQQFFPPATVQVNQEVTDAKDLALNHRPNLIAEAGNRLLPLKILFRLRPSQAQVQASP